ncbi:MAG: Fibronectin type III domain protein [Syntrophus sp. PtaU1.Bin208]|nr:MAG: Fibronectin type III domain protein [Syntrophus sp. PtaU1.Bin208]
MKEKKNIYRGMDKHNIFFQMMFRGLFAVLFLCLLLIGPGSGQAANVTLTWDKNTETDLAGYVVYSGTSAGSYTESIDVGNLNSVDLSGLQEGTTYYYAAKAYNTAGLYSEYSNEVSYNAPVSTYTITGSCGSNGSMSPSGAVSVTSGGSQSFTITPDSGYAVSSVLVDGASAGTPTSYTFSNVTANHTIAVTFAALAKYTITATYTSGGTITPSGTVSLSSGGSQTYTMTPKTGYKIYSVLVDGVKVGTPTSYAFSNVTRNHTIKVTFRKK